MVQDCRYYSLIFQVIRKNIYSYYPRYTLYNEGAMLKELEGIICSDQLVKAYAVASSHLLVPDSRAQASL